MWPGRCAAWRSADPAPARLINAFYDRVENDELIAPLFPGGVSAEHREHVVAWWIEVFGGSEGYSENFGGHHHMINRHANLAITPEQRFRFASLMSLAADDAEVEAGRCRFGCGQRLRSDGARNYPRQMRMLTGVPTPMGRTQSPGG